MTIGNKDDLLISIVERIVRLKQEQRERADDVKEVMQEAKSAGYDLPALRLVVKRALEDADKRKKREDAEQIAEAMAAALGGLIELPLGAAAMERVG